MKEIIKNTIILCLITCIAGALLGAVYKVTLKPRQLAEEKAKEEAYKKVMSQADIFEGVEYNKTELETYLSANKEKLPSGCLLYEAATALSKEGNTLGYAITVISKEGYGGDIKLTIGIDTEGIVKGIAILDINETAGLGMKANEPSFLNQYKDKNCDSYVVTKGGAKNENEIDAISGATITSKAMTNGVNYGKLIYDFLTSTSKGESNE